MQNYIKIKSNIFKHQIKNDFAIYPFCLHESISKYVSLQQRSFLFNQKKPDNCILQPNQTIVWIENEIIYLQSFKSQVKEIGTIHAHCPLFAETQMIIFIVGYILQYSTTNISNKINTIHIPPHRLEKLGNFNGIIIYNDSKSTTPACTQAAIEKLSSTCSRIHLIIGGLSKGIDRSFLFTYIATKKNIQVYLFGAEAETLFQMGLANNAPCKKENSLEKVVMLCKQNASKNDCILFSPAGSSFDLYANYIERGNHFKTIIKELFENTL